MNQIVYPCLWCDHCAKEAAEFYCGIFPNSTMVADNGLVVQFSLNGSRMMALNGGPLFKPTEALSLVIECDTQEEIDHYWHALTQGGKEGRCGWLTDRFGVSWQVVPRQLGALLSNPSEAKAVMEALMNMNKLELPVLLAAAHAS